MKRNGLKYLTLRERKALAEYLTRLREQFGDQIQHVILYGSKVRGDFDAESDIDLFVVVNNPDEKIEDALTRLVVNVDLKYDVLLSDFIASPERYQRMANIQEPLYQNLQSEGVDLWMKIPESLLTSASKRRKTISSTPTHSSNKAVIAKRSAARTTRSLR